MQARRPRNSRAGPAAIVAAVALALAGCETRSGPPPTDAAALSTREVANRFLGQAFADGDVRGAYERYSTPDFKQHDPDIDANDHHLAESRDASDTSALSHSARIHTRERCAHRDVPLPLEPKAAGFERIVRVDPREGGATAQVSPATAVDHRIAVRCEALEYPA
jgi:hypothetical protein